jgi:hypothetical protein
MSAGTLLGTLNFPPSPPHGSGSREQRFPSSIQLPKLHSRFDNTPSSRNGLRTPPSDEMSTVFQPPLASWENHAIHNYPAAVPQTARPAAPVADASGSQYYRYPTQQQDQQQQQQTQTQTTYNRYYQHEQSTQPQLELHPTSQVSQHRNGSISAESQAVGQTARASTPASTASGSKDESESLVYHSLQIPKCISPSGGNLADFAAQVCGLEQTSWNSQFC